MKRGWMLLLLVSLGVNVGFGSYLAVTRLGGGDRTPTETISGREDVAAGAVRDSSAVRHHVQRRLVRLSRELNLDPAQRDSLTRIQLAAGFELHQFRRAIVAERRRLRDAYVDGEFDREQLLADQRRVSRLQADLDSLMVETMIREMQVLRPDQRERYQELIPWGPDGSGHRSRRGRENRARNSRQ